MVLTESAQCMNRALCTKIKQKLKFETILPLSLVSFSCIECIRQVATHVLSITRRMYSMHETNVSGGIESQSFKFCLILVNIYNI